MLHVELCKKNVPQGYTIKVGGEYIQSCVTGEMLLYLCYFLEVLSV